MGGKWASNGDDRRQGRPEGAPSPKRLTPARLASAAGAVVATVGAVLRATNLVSTSGLVHTSGVVTCALGVAMIGRDAIHVRGGYWRFRGSKSEHWTPRQSRWLSLLVVAEALLGVSLVIGGLAILLSEPDHWETLALVIVAAIAAWWLMSTKFDLASASGLPRGTEVVRRLRAVRRLRREVKKVSWVPGVNQVYWVLFIARSPRNRLSGLVVMVAGSFFLVFVTQVIAVAPDVARRLDPPPHKAQVVAPRERTAKRRGDATAAAPTRQGDESRPPSPPDATAVSAPTYDENCGSSVEPGDGIPGVMSDEMYNAWLAFGEPTYGCAERAVRVVNGLDVWAAIGHCQGAFRSVGVVSPEHPAAVVLAEAALLAREFFTQGTLRGASARTSFGNGDFYIVYSTQGSWLAIRSQTTDGHGGVARVPAHCSEVEPGGFPYVLLPPAMGDLYVRAAAQLGRGIVIVRDPSRDRSDRTAYALLGGGGMSVPLAYGSCTTTSDAVCHLEGGGLDMSESNSEAQELSVERVEEAAPLP